ncbi:hypothetical protein [Sphingobium tyrosinilyticum]|uniref:Uncharacterized protein n=1 Tax=Sphingobium tyrosinilyticum TaxID=2715436 RepID=A0ABV9F108_9SPHN
MSGIAEAGLIFLVIFILGFFERRDDGAGRRTYDQDEETWWSARRSWGEDRR